MHMYMQYYIHAMCVYIYININKPEHQVLINEELNLV